jgi:hypothetical protein
MSMEAIVEIEMSGRRRERRTFRCCWQSAGVDWLRAVLLLCTARLYARLCYSNLRHCPPGPQRLVIVMWECKSVVSVEGTRRERRQ